MNLKKLFIIIKKIWGKNFILSPLEHLSKVSSKSIYLEIHMEQTYLRIFCTRTQ